MGPEIYTNLPLPKGIVGLLPYTMSKKELDKMLKEEPDNTSKEGIIETLNEDKTQVDSSRN
jgi:hypothetical protein